MKTASGRSSVAGRRQFLLAAGSALSFAALVASPSAFAQSIPRIGFIRHGSADALSESFRQGLRDLGYIEGKTIIVEYRWTEGRTDRIAPFIDELVRMKVKVIVGSGDSVVQALHKTNRTIPVVMTNSGNPVRFGYAASLARPGGNMTGMTTIGTELTGKRIELLRETFPSIRKIAFIWDRTADPEQLGSGQSAAKALGLSFESFEVRTPDDLGSAFSAATKSRADGAVVIGSSVMFGERTYIAILAVKSNLPAMFPHSAFVDTGGLMSYGTSFVELFRRSATFVDKILKGAKPADLPIEQPTRFELVLNRKTAKLIGVTFPQHVVVRADRVIE